MYEDWFLDENFKVESGFIDSLETNEDLNIALKNMQPCNNCGEWVTKSNLVAGFCNLCNTSDFHKEK